MNIKRWLGLFIISLLILSGCEQNETTKTLKLMLSGLQQPSEKTFFRTFVRLFEAEHGIKIELVYESPDTMLTTITNNPAIADVIMVDTARMKPYIDLKLLTDINFIDLEADRTFSTLFDTYTNEGDDRYFVPISLDVYLTIYNKEALPYMPNSVDVSKNTENQITQIESITWQELSIWAKAIKTETGEAKFGFPNASIGSQLIYPITGIGLAMGSHHLPSFNDTGAVKAWSYLYDLYQHEALAYGPTFSSLTQPTELLSSNDLWISFGHMGPIGNAYLTNPNKYVLGPIPTDETTLQAGSTAGAWAYGMLKDANKEVSKAWIKFITDPEINYLYCSGLGGVISPIYEVTEHLGQSNSDKIMALGLKMIDQAVKIEVVNTSEYTSWNDVKLLYNALYQKLIDGFTIDEALLNTYQESLEELENPK